ncbi:MAG: cation diffusion facilitator family transporter [Solirubrobacteraceae bacterium]
MTGKQMMSIQQRTALSSVAIAAALAAIKLIVGLFSHSLGMIAEAIHSGTDFVAALLTFFAVGVAVRPPDREHPFGHGKAEHLSALGEGAVLVVASIGIAVEAITRLTSGAHGWKRSGT